MWADGVPWSPTHMETTPTLYERIGGAPAIEAAVRGMYDKVLADPMLAPFFPFGSSRMERLVRTQCDFIGSAIGGPEVYRGRDMKSAHRRYAIETAHFQRVAEHLTATLDELGVGANEVADLLAVVATVHDDVVTVPEAAAS
jgi:hemoglobin